MKNGRREKSKVEMKNNEAITLIALVITVVVILILARSKYCNFNRRQWITNKNE